jgi:putative hemolysin
MNRYKSGSRRLLVVLVTLILASLLSACVGISQEVMMPSVEPAQEPQPGMANPASVFCEEQGGRLEIRTAADGGQFGVCLFADGSECEEWAFFNGECQPDGQPAATIEPEVANPAAAYCVQQGGKSMILPDQAGNQVGKCVFADGSQCDEWAFYRGECRPAGQAAPTPALAGVPAPDVAVEEILAQIQLPADAYSDSPAVLPLRTPEDSPPLWALYSTGMRNYELDPVPSHFVAIFTRDEAGWRELARIDLDQRPAEDTLLVEPLPDYIYPSGVQQVAIEPSRVWLTVDGGAGAHSGTFQLLSFDGQALSLELASSAASPGAGFIADVNQDGQNDVVFNATDPYVFCYACGVRHPYFQVHTWLGDGLDQVELSALMMGQRGTPPDEANSAAVALAQAGLWHDALTKSDEAVALAGDDDPPTPAGSLRWNQALIRLNHDAQARAVQDSAYPLLSQVFYGDYAAAVDLMRPYSIEQIFSADTPLVSGTAAEGWQAELSGYLLGSADAALAVQPELAPAWFVRAWGRYLADPADPRVALDAARAAELAPDDALYAAAVAALPAPSPPAAQSSQEPAVRIRFAAGGTSVTVPGNIGPGQVRQYVLGASQGQTMTVSVAAPNNDVALAIWGADGTVLLSDHAGATEWQGTLPATQDYYLGLSGAAEPTLFRLSVSIPPLGQ